VEKAQLLAPLTTYGVSGYVDQISVRHLKRRNGKHGFVIAGSWDVSAVCQSSSRRLQSQGRYNAEEHIPHVGISPMHIWTRRSSEYSSVAREDVKD
jgi:hypothetical protein